MASLLQLRDAIALNGSAEASQLSRQLAIPLPLVNAMLEKLTAMGKIERIELDHSGCLTGSCKSCPEGHQHCNTVIYQLKEPHAHQ
ncbi:ferrous iron transporter C [Yersinia pestis]|uniref:Probable [Fe-S]-dependent transcriptional repressor n=23 Tax=Yersinia pseudotuberculosis complex TaxID=1649845 RepID=FEOC_YERPE|nr:MULTISPECIES: FeoC-like transcriptional regulator [Yersinia pseudotuberculosis complex]A4TGS1.1 RecName: Full=Probable [Fe-S]-dependent transcriptional repressor [Yersinia pestis Pestoides F]A7FNV6.1 RecName: Full=Probable [Fe-S]-dependent transcriptional repressor [Yersinia pseudotuberculosis IP 31758]B1JHZ7.1 RecName: Full=Probable [Fe-S]-dependent transcriptional repressor [Yersinia pseudotuberculosis YPIII]B2K5V5.1 RecName: Full=Probable [Fe-S]-dependent transcriptional repressor [Yersin